MDLLTRFLAKERQDRKMKNALKVVDPEERAPDYDQIQQVIESKYDWFMKTSESYITNGIPKTGTKEVRN
jgi:hypothetical protein